MKNSTLLRRDKLVKEISKIIEGVSISDISQVLNALDYVIPNTLHQRTSIRIGGITLQPVIKKAGFIKGFDGKLTFYPSTIRPVASSTGKFKNYDNNRASGIKSKTR